MPVAFKSSGAGTGTETSGADLAPLCPATVDANDILIAHVMHTGTSTGPSTPSGWSLLYGPANVGTTATARHWCFGKLASGGEDGASVSFGTAGGTNGRAARIYSFSGYVSGAIEDVVPAASFSDIPHATDPQGPSVTTTVAGALAVALMCQDDNNTPPAITGMSGGTWAENAEYVNATWGPQGIQMSINTCTPTGDPGTVSGGAQVATNDEAGTIGFEIRPEVPAVTGTSAPTGAADTSAASGTITVAGTSAPAGAADASSAAGTVTVTGTSAPANAADTGAAAGEVSAGAISGTSAVTGAADAGSAAGAIAVIGASAAEGAADSSSAAGAVAAIGASAPTGAADASSASGTVTVEGAAAATSGADTGAAAGEVSAAAITGTSAAVSAADAAAATGEVSGEAEAPPASDGPWRLISGDYPRPAPRPRKKLPPFPELPLPAAPRLPGVRVVLDPERIVRLEIEGALAGPALDLVSAVDLVPAEDPALAAARRQAANDEELAIALLLAA